MPKYKQKYFPETSLFKINDKKKLSTLVSDYYKKNLQGKHIVTCDKNLTVYFTSDGLGKISKNRRIGEINAAAVKIIDQLLKYGEYSNFGQRKNTDKKNVLYYVNFKSSAFIDGKKRHFRISVKVKDDFKAYYNHTVNRYIGDNI